MDAGQAFYRVPDSVPSGMAGTANCALSHVLFAMELMDIKYVDTIVIHGAGGLGLNGIAAAKARGARVIVIEGVPERIALAKRFGADEVIDMNEYGTEEARRDRVMELTGGLGADADLDVAPSVPTVFREAISMLRPGGRMLDIGDLKPGRKVEIDPAVITLRNITVTGLQTYPDNYLYKALMFLEKYHNKFPFDEIISKDEFPLERVVDAVEISKKRGVSRACIVME